MTTDCVSFAALPYVKVNKEIRFSDYKLWPNTKDEWERQTGRDCTSFMEIYRTSEDEPVGRSASVLCRQDLGELEMDACFRAVVVLSTATWLQGDASADPWVHEVWRLNVPSGGTYQPNTFYLRCEKYVRNMTDTAHDRVFPTPYAHPLHLNTDNLKPYLDFLEDELLVRPTGNLMRALNYFHRCRFNTPYFSSIYWDIESMWAGFEAFFGFRKTLETPTQKCVARIARTTLPPRWCRQLGWRDRPRRDEHLVSRLKAELSPLDLSDNFWSGVDRWANVAYGIRNAVAHGGSIDETKVWMSEYDQHVLGVGLSIFENILKRRVYGQDIFRDFDVANELYATFSAKTVTERLLETLSKSDRKDWYGDDGMAGRPELVDRVEKEIQEFCGLPNVRRNYKGKPQVAAARWTMGLVLSQWLKELSKTELPGIRQIVLTAMLNVINVTVDEARQQGRSPREIDDIVGEKLAYSMIRRKPAWPETYLFDPSMDSGHLKLGGKIPFWTWLEAYIRLEEMYLGRALG